MFLSKFLVLSRDFSLKVIVDTASFQQQVNGARKERKPMILAD